MKILFLDQTGSIGGAERSLADIAEFYPDRCLVALFEDGPYRKLLEQRSIPVQVIAKQAIKFRRESGLIQGLNSLSQLIPLITTVVQLSRNYDLIHANTPKALVVGAIASFLSGSPLVYHLRDILTPEHFSQTNRRIIVTLANRFAAKVIAVSKATKNAFVEAGGNPDITEVIYNGFEAEKFQGHEAEGTRLRQALGLNDSFVVGHFSRLSPWKGQHVLIEALSHCPDNIVALLVGDALFGEQDYAEQLHQQVIDLGLESRVHFLGFRSDVPALITACDVVTHTSTAPEPSSRVLIETMLSGKPLIATEDGGSVEVVDHNQTGWLIAPGDAIALATKLTELQTQPDHLAAVAAHARNEAAHRFRLDNTRAQVHQLLQTVLEEA